MAKKPPIRHSFGRGLSKRVKTARGRKSSSTRWLQRQLNDPYVEEAKRMGFRSRAAFKILEIDEQMNLFKKGMKIVDLGAAPGGWTQVAVQACGSKSTVVALDLLPIEPIQGATIITGDFNDDGVYEQLLRELGDHKLDGVLSDMAPATTGHKQTDHLRIIGLAEVAFDFAKRTLAPGGFFVCKIFQGGATSELLVDLKKNFTRVKHIKPPSSRPDSSEMFVVAVGFRG